MTPILVTGGAKGLGAAICRQLAAEGHDLVIHYRASESEALQLAQECRQHSVEVDTIYGDFRDPDSVKRFIDGYLERFSQTKGLVNNIGNYLVAPLIDTTMSQWLALFQTNFFAPISLVQALLPSLRMHRGSIVNIGLAGLQANRGFTKIMAHAATKSALLFYTLSLAKELAQDAIRVNMVSPGYLENAVDIKDFSELPFKRVAFLHEAAHLVAYLFDPKSAYITGQNIEIAGGVGL